VTNGQGDVIGIIRGNGTQVVGYRYDAWGNVKEVSGSMSGTLGKANPLRYRGYVYDEETKLYYLESRYYDPEVGRFINADAYAATGQGFVGNNMFAYCLNNPVNMMDSTGEFSIGIAVKRAVLELAAAARSFTGEPNPDLVNAPDLDIDTATEDSYNCYGNALGKQTVTDPVGYNHGDSTRETFELVVRDLGKENIRELDSINSPIFEDEYMVALKCGPYDYHFIPFDGERWYDKPGRNTGFYVDQSFIEAEIWYTWYMEEGTVKSADLKWGYLYYDDETIYFAVKVGWDE